VSSNVAEERNIYTYTNITSNGQLHVIYKRTNTCMSYNIENKICPTIHVTVNFKGYTICSRKDIKDKHSFKLHGNMYKKDSSIVEDASFKNYMIKYIRRNARL